MFQLFKNKLLFKNWIYLIIRQYQHWSIIKKNLFWNQYFYTQFTLQFRLQFRLQF